jgi:succinate dehydrogenase/fumarate reductase flavoprotein subunit
MSQRLDTPPLVRIGDVTNWTDVADVVIVGYGAAGASAAIEARRAGADTLVSKPLDKPPYAAFDLSVGRAKFAGFSLGGLRTSVDSEVLSCARRPVEGLYAAGACAWNLAQDTRGYSSGTCLGQATYFGRRAGAHAAARLAH